MGMDIWIMAALLIVVLHFNQSRCLSTKAEMVTLNLCVFR